MLDEGFVQVILLNRADLKCVQLVYYIFSLQYIIAPMGRCSKEGRLLPHHSLCHMS